MSVTQTLRFLVKYSSNGMLIAADRFKGSCIWVKCAFLLSVAAFDSP